MHEKSTAGQTVNVIMHVIHQEGKHKILFWYKDVKIAGLSQQDIHLHI